MKHNLSLYSILFGLFVYFYPSDSFSQPKTWNWIGPDQFYAKIIEISPSDPNIIFISNGSEVYKTTNSGINWLKLPTFSACGSIGAIAVDPANGNIVYALDYSGG